MNNIIDLLPKMIAGDDLTEALTIMPEYDKGICNQDKAIRLMALSDLYRVYLPSQMTIEIYSKLYLALIRSLKKKVTKTAVRQQNANRQAILRQGYNGIIGGSDSFTIIGTSGIGKSSAISRAVELITDNRIIETTEPYTKIIPCVIVQCPFDSSVKGLLLEILRKVDEHLETKYYENALRARATVDMMIGSVSQAALNHIGLLIVDEIQNVCNSKNGKSLVGMLTQLINNSGISICMVGTPESSYFFEQAMQLARRSLGLNYNTMKYDEYFRQFCEILFSYRYVQNESPLSDAVIEWLYEHSAGVISVVVSLVHDAQEIAILNGKEILNSETLNEAYRERLTHLHEFIQPAKSAKKYVKPGEKGIADKLPDNQDIIAEYTISELVSQAKKEKSDIVCLLKKYMPVEEVSI
ncbi:MAG: TniB family NTP-binding protein [bacterium]|nr:TniB family NTP-binding protein [bacterium]